MTLIMKITVDVLYFCLMKNFQHIFVDVYSLFTYANKGGDNISMGIESREYHFRPNASTKSKPAMM